MLLSANIFTSQFQRYLMTTGFNIDLPPPNKVIIFKDFATMRLSRYVVLECRFTHPLLSPVPFSNRIQYKLCEHAEQH